MGCEVIFWFNLCWLRLLTEMSDKMKYIQELSLFWHWLILQKNLEDNMNLFLTFNFDATRSQVSELGKPTYPRLKFTGPLFCFFQQNRIAQWLFTLIFFTYFHQIDHLRNLFFHAFNGHIPRNQRSHSYAYRVTLIFIASLFLLSVEVTGKRNIFSFTDCTFNFALSEEPQKYLEFLTTL